MQMDQAPKVGRMEWVGIKVWESGSEDQTLTDAVCVACHLPKAKTVLIMVP